MYFLENKKVFMGLNLFNIVGITCRKENFFSSSFISPSTPESPIIQGVSRQTSEIITA